MYICLCFSNVIPLEICVCNVVSRGCLIVQKYMYICLCFSNVISLEICCLQCNFLLLLQSPPHHNWHYHHQLILHTKMYPPDSDLNGLIRLFNLWIALVGYPSPPPPPLPIQRHFSHQMTSSTHGAEM